MGMKSLNINGTMESFDYEENKMENLNITFNQLKSQNSSNSSSSDSSSYLIKDTLKNFSLENLKITINMDSFKNKSLFDTMENCQVNNLILIIKEKYVEGIDYDPYISHYGEYYQESFLSEIKSFGFLTKYAKNCTFKNITLIIKGWFDIRPQNDAQIDAFGALIGTCSGNITLENIFIKMSDTLTINAWFTGGVIGKYHQGNNLKLEGVSVYGRYRYDSNETQQILADGTARGGIIGKIVYIDTTKEVFLNNVSSICKYDISDQLGMVVGESNAHLQVIQASIMGQLNSQFENDWYWIQQNQLAGNDWSSPISKAFYRFHQYNYIEYIPQTQPENEEYKNEYNKLFTYYNSELFKEANNELENINFDKTQLIASPVFNMIRERRFANYMYREYPNFTKRGFYNENSKEKRGLPIYNFFIDGGFPLLKEFCEYWELEDFTALANVEAGAFPYNEFSIDAFQKKYRLELKNFDL